MSRPDYQQEEWENRAAWVGLVFAATGVVLFILFA